MDVFTHTCPNCSGPLTFEPSDQKFHCPYCLSVFTADELSEFEEKQKAARLAEEQPSPTEPSSSDSSEETQTTTDTTSNPEDSAETDHAMDLFTCPSCGAEIVTDATTAATYCYFCHNPVVLTGRLSGKFLPNKVLPFQINKEEATKKFLEWAQKKWFVPKDFFNKAQVEKLTGVYFPYWSVDADAEGSLQGVGTSLRVWVIGDIEYTETREYSIQRQGKLTFKDYVKNALSKNVQQKMVEAVQPFPVEKALAFENQYLSGFQAEKRDIEYIDIQEDVQDDLHQMGEQLLSDTVSGYTTFRVADSSFNLTSENNQYVLLPVWLVTYRANSRDKKTFYYAMNGYTGNTSGILPLSYGKLFGACAALFTFLAILFMIGGYLL